jgi:hypothetical protein
MAGQYFETQLHPVAKSSVDIVSIDSFKQYRPGTKVALLLGEEAMKLYGEKIALNDARGNPITDGDGVIHIPTYTPQDAFDRKNYESEDEETEGGDDDIKGHGTTKRKNWRWWMSSDVKKAVRILKHGGLPAEESYDKFNFNINPDIEEACKVLEETKNQILFLDIETTFGQTLTCTGFNFSGDNNIWVVPWKKYNNTLAYDARFCRRFIQALCIAMHNNLVVAHNASFDLLVLCSRYKIPVPKRIFDTMLAWHRCHPEIEKSLGHLISYFLHQPYHKAEGIYHPRNYVQEQQLYNYNAKDIVTMRWIYYHLLEEIKKCKAESSVAWVNRMPRAYLTQTMRGLALDKELFTKRYDQLDTKRLQINRVIQKLVGIPDFNPRSWQQVGGYLYEGLKLPCPDEDNPTNSKTLLKLLVKFNVPSVKLILLGRKIAKTASSMKFRCWPDIDGTYNRFTCVYNPAGTDTFRLGSRAVFRYKRGTESDKKGYGSNGQNWDKDQRDLVVADFGKKLGQVDQSGAEALIVSYLCRNGKFRELFLYGVKPHVFVGLHVFKDQWKKRVRNSNVIDELCLLRPSALGQHPAFKEVKDLISDSDNWAAHERFYFIAKMICHAFNYGMKGKTFQTNVLEKSEGAIVLELKICEIFYKLYHGLFPEIQLWHYDIRQTVTNTRVLTNLFGEPRHFVAPLGDDLWRAAYAFIGQSTVGEITNYAITEMQEEVDNNLHRDIGFEMLQNNHDSGLFQFNDNPVAEMEACKRFSVKLNRELVSPRGEKFRMKSECQTGYNWRPFKKEYNERGLQGFKLN